MRITIEKVMVGTCCCDVTAIVTEKDVIISKIVDHESLEELELAAIYHSQIWKIPLKRAVLINLFREKYINNVINQK